MGLSSFTYLSLTITILLGIGYAQSILVLMNGYPGFCFLRPSSNIALCIPSTEHGVSSVIPC